MDRTDGTTGRPISRNDAPRRATRADVNGVAGMTTYYTLNHYIYKWDPPNNLNWLRNGEWTKYDETIFRLSRVEDIMDRRISVLEATLLFPQVVL